MAKSTTSKKSKPVKKEAAPAAPKAAPKAAAPKVVAPKAKAPVATAPAPAKAKSSQKTISAQDRYHMIDEAAYYRAEKSGFQVDPHANWIAAEEEINELLAKQNIKVV